MDSAVRAAVPSAARTHADGEPNLVGMFVGVVVAAAILVVVFVGGAAWSGIAVRPATFGIFAVLTIVLQFLMINVYDRGSISISGVGMLAAGFVFGPGAAALVALPAAAAHALVRRPLWYRAFFNVATFALSAAAGSGVYQSIAAPGHGWSDSANLLPATAGSVTFTLVNVGLLSTAMALAEGLPVIEVWRERFRWLTPHYVAFGPLALGLTVAEQRIGVIGVIAFTLPPTLLSIVQRQYVARTRESVESLREANEALGVSNAELAEMALRLRQTLRNTTTALSRSIEAKDGYTGGHVSRVATISVALAERLGLEGEELEGVELGAILHDVGKIAVPDRILHKPAPLDEEEWRLMKTHPVHSERIICDVGLHPFAVQAARSSHERIDGKGYPDGLAGEDIPISARIVLVADAWDALTSDRPYRKSRDVASALAEVRANTGTQFCPRVVAALEQIYAETPDLLAPESTGEGAVVDLPSRSRARRTG